MTNSTMLALVAFPFVVMASVFAVMWSLHWAYQYCREFVFRWRLRNYLKTKTKEMQDLARVMPKVGASAEELAQAFSSFAAAWRASTPPLPQPAPVEERA